MDRRTDKLLMTMTSMEEEENPDASLSDVDTSCDNHLLQSDQVSDDNNNSRSNSVSGSKSPSPQVSVTTKNGRSGLMYFFQCVFFYLFHVNWKKRPSTLRILMVNVCLILSASLFLMSWVLTYLILIVPSGIVLLHILKYVLNVPTVPLEL